MLNRFFLLCKNPHPPVLNRQYCAGRNTNHWMEYQPKSNEKFMPFSQYISSFEGTFYKQIYGTTTKSFNCCCFTLAFTLEDIICRTSFNIIEKNDFC